MRLKLIFLINKKEFPKDYRRYFISFIKHSLISGDNEFYQLNYERNKNLIKPFTFAIYFVKPKFEKDMIYISEDKVTMNISFGDYEYGVRFYNSFVQQLNKPYELGNGINMELKTIQLSKETRINTSSIRVMTLSPIIVRQHESNTDNHDRYLKYSDKEFQKHLKDTISCSIKANKLLNIEKVDAKLTELVISSIKMKSIPVCHYLERIGTYLEGNIGELLIEGDTEILEHLYKVGIGSRTAQGFGMVEVL